MWRSLASPIAPLVVVSEVVISARESVAMVTNRRRALTCCWPRSSTSSEVGQRLTRTLLQEGSGPRRTSSARRAGAVPCLNS